jgi:hypothetical protein
VRSSKSASQPIYDLAALARGKPCAFLPGRIAAGRFYSAAFSVLLFAALLVTGIPKHFEIAPHPCSLAALPDLCIDSGAACRKNF